MQAQEPLQRVVAGKPISAADWNRIVDRINAGATATVRAKTPTAPTRRELRVRNDSGVALGFLSVVAVRGFASPQIDLAAALNDAAVLSVGLPTGADGEFLATLREPIEPNGVGTATSATGSAFLAEVVGASDGALGFAALATDGENAGKLVAATAGAFRIVARSDSGVCLLTPPSAPPTLKTTAASVVWSLTPLEFVDVVPAGATTTCDVVVDVRAVVESTAKNGGIPFVSNIECVDGKLVVTTRYLNIVVDTNQRVVVDPTASTSVVSGGVFPVSRVSVVKTAELE